jgi:hypothetical protein
MEKLVQPLTEDTAAARRLPPRTPDGTSTQN